MAAETARTGYRRGFRDGSPSLHRTDPYGTAGLRGGPRPTPGLISWSWLTAQYDPGRPKSVGFGGLRRSALRLPLGPTAEAVGFRLHSVIDSESSQRYNAQSNVGFNLRFENGEITGHDCSCERTLDPCEHIAGALIALPSVATCYV